MNVRLSEHCSLKRTKRREDSPVRLPVRLRVRLSLQPQHSIFEKFPSGPEMSFEARSCKLLLNFEPLNSKCLKYIPKRCFKQNRDMAIINIVR